MVRIISNNTKKVNGHFPHTKELFRKANILTIHNLYFYMCANEAKKILCLGKPLLLYDKFIKSTRTDRLILPKFSYSSYSANSFVFQASKIFNLFLAQDIYYTRNSIETFKAKIKKQLQTLQGITINQDPNWYPFNTNIFTDISIS